MKQKAAVSTTQSLSENTLTLSRLALDFADTAWRISVPVVIFAVAGIYFDKTYTTGPWITLMGMVVGFASAGLLVRKQIATVKQREKIS